MKPIGNPGTSAPQGREDVSAESWTVAFSPGFTILIHRDEVDRHSLRIEATFPAGSAFEAEMIAAVITQDIEKPLRDALHAINVSWRRYAFRRSAE